MDDETAAIPAATAPGAATLEYLDALAAGAFKRQEELDESVWRSLPFFAAAFALAVTIVSRTADAAPPPAFGVYAIVVNAVLALALASFGWALRWFYEVLRPRRYDYPPAPTDVREFASDMTAYYATRDDSDADASVVGELRQMMIAAHASATRTNFLLNEARLEARGQLILFLMAGFLMTLACEAIIYSHDLVGQIAIRKGSSDGRDSSAGDAAAARGGREARAAEGLHAGAGSQVPALERRAQADSQVVTDEVLTDKVRPLSPQPAAAKPAPPPFRTLKKTQGPPPPQR